MHRKILTVLLCGLMTAGPTSSFAADKAKKTKQPPAKQINQLIGDQRIEYALNRLTFGPRPGDIDAVKKMGLDAWFEQQLHPEQIDETTLNAQLVNFPSIQKLNIAELMLRFPDNEKVREAMNSKLPMPENPIERKIYEVQVTRMKEKAEEKRQAEEAAAEMNAPPATQAAPTMGMLEVAQPEATIKNAAYQPSTADTTPTKKSEKKELKADLRVQYEQLIQQLLTLPPDQRLKKMLTLTADEIDNVRIAMRAPEKQMLVEGMDPEQREIMLSFDNPHQLVVDELSGQRVTRDIYANAQLYEVMTDFWLNHFNIFINKNVYMPYYLSSFERDVIRPRALGKFEDLLESTAHSPAMMAYLDNAQSIGPNSLAAARPQNKQAKKPSQGLNENYARELMELHTVGVNGGYTQADVTEVARILTGWTVEKPLQLADFKFEPRRHEPGTKTVMGVEFKENGEQEGKALIHFLATRPATAQFISRKLAVRFVSDNPPQSLIDRMAKTFLTSGGDIKEVLRTMFRSPEFWSVENYRAKLKTPEEFVISAVRASDIQPKNPQVIVNAIRNLGMSLYGAMPPTGYSWKSDAWLNSGELVSRMNYALSLALNHENGCRRSWSIPPDAWDAQTQMSIVPADEEARIEKELLGVGLKDTTRAAILRQITDQTATDNPTRPVSEQEAATFKSHVKLSPAQLEAKDETLAGLLLGSPEFQRR